MVPEARVELARPKGQRILSPLRLPVPPLGQIKNTKNYGGGGRNRTGVHGFAIRCMTILPPRQQLFFDLITDFIQIN